MAVLRTQRGGADVFSVSCPVFSRTCLACCCVYVLPSVAVGNTGSIERILRGPAKLDDGTHNLLGCLKTSMGTLGARTIREMQNVEIVVAPSLLTEGKVYQKAQRLGMGK